MCHGSPKQPPADLPMRPLRGVLLLVCCVPLTGCLLMAERPAPVSSITPRAPPPALSQSLSQPSPDIGGSVVKVAMDLRGAPYRFGGAAPEEGFDCSGFVWYVFGRHGVQLPRMAAAMAATLPPVEDGALQAGDLVFFNTRGSRFSHVGIYIGDDRFVHAPSKRTGRVIVSDMKGPYWRKRFNGTRRPPLATSI